LIFSDPGAGIEAEHIDQVLENFSAFAPAKTHLLKPENAHFCLLS
jgi:hypothetical protein